MCCAESFRGFRGLSVSRRALQGASLFSLSDSVYNFRDTEKHPDRLFVLGRHTALAICDARCALQSDVDLSGRPLSRPSGTCRARLWSARLYSACDDRPFRRLAPWSTGHPGTRNHAWTSAKPVPDCPPISSDQTLACRILYSSLASTSWLLICYPSSWSLLRVPCPPPEI